LRPLTRAWYIEVDPQHALKIQCSNQEVMLYLQEQVSMHFCLLFSMVWVECHIDHARLAAAYCGYICIFLLWCTDCIHLAYI